MPVFSGKLTLPLLATAGALVFGAAAPVAAQPYGENALPPAGEIVVMPTPQRTSIGFPTADVSYSVPVYVGDLNLATAAGHRVLRDRVERAAEIGCWQLEDNPVFIFTGTRAGCQARAVARTMASFGF